LNYPYKVLVKKPKNPLPEPVPNFSPDFSTNFSEVSTPPPSQFAPPQFTPQNAPSTELTPAQALINRAKEMQINTKTENF
jgi:hypothetical protein